MVLMKKSSKHLFKFNGQKCDFASFIDNFMLFYINNYSDIHNLNMHIYLYT